MPPEWLTPVAWIWLGLAFASVLVMLVDIGRGDRHARHSVPRTGRDLDEPLRRGLHDRRHRR